ncbi:hypothetical protein BY996DRAFT_6408983 [Phakopsora pachyrhizi]|nr:hypothetical protein BY996DRAFT_6408983 [Phakopsora pachyrhizi]
MSKVEEVVEFNRLSTTGLELIQGVSLVSTLADTSTDERDDDGDDKDEDQTDRLDQRLGQIAIDFVQQDYLLNESQSDIAHRELPGAFSDRESSDQPQERSLSNPSWFSGWIERILSNLRFELNDLSVMIDHHSDRSSSPSVELLVTLESAQTIDTVEPKDRQANQRQLRLTRPEVYLRPTNLESESNIQSGSVQSSDQDHLLMSQAISDLRLRSIQPESESQFSDIQFSHSLREISRPEYRILSLSSDPNNETVVQSVASFKTASESSMRSSPHLLRDSIRLMFSIIRPGVGGTVEDPHAGGEGSSEDRAQRQSNDILLEFQLIIPHSLQLSVPSLNHLSVIGELLNFFLGGDSEQSTRKHSGRGVVPLKSSASSIHILIKVNQIELKFDFKPLSSDVAVVPNEVKEQDGCSVSFRVRNLEIELNHHTPQASTDSATDISDLRIKLDQFKGTLGLPSDLKRSERSDRLPNRVFLLSPVSQSVRPGIWINYTINRSNDETGPVVRINLDSIWFNLNTDLFGPLIKSIESLHHSLSKTDKSRNLLKSEPSSINTSSSPPSSSKQVSSAKILVNVSRLYIDTKVLTDKQSQKIHKDREIDLVLGTVVKTLEISYQSPEGLELTVSEAAIGFRIGDSDHSSVGHNQLKPFLGLARSFSNSSPSIPNNRRVYPGLRMNIRFDEDPSLSKAGANKKDDDSFEKSLKEMTRGFVLVEMESVRMDLTKRQFDRLQYWLDDLGRWVPSNLFKERSSINVQTIKRPKKQQVVEEEDWGDLGVNSGRKKDDRNERMVEVRIRRIDLTIRFDECPSEQNRILIRLNCLRFYQLYKNVRRIPPISKTGGSSSSSSSSSLPLLCFENRLKLEIRSVLVDLIERENRSKERSNRVVNLVWIKGYGDDSRKKAEEEEREKFVDGGVIGIDLLNCTIPNLSSDQRVIINSDDDNYSKRSKEEENKKSSRMMNFLDVRFERINFCIRNELLRLKDELIEFLKPPAGVFEAVESEYETEVLFVIRVDESEPIIIENGEVFFNLGEKVFSNNLGPLEDQRARGAKMIFGLGGGDDDGDDKNKVNVYNCDDDKDFIDFQGFKIVIERSIISEGEKLDAEGYKINFKSNDKEIFGSREIINSKGTNEKDVNTGKLMRKSTRVLILGGDLSFSICADSIESLNRSIEGIKSFAISDDRGTDRVNFKKEFKNLQNQLEGGYTRNYDDFSEKVCGEAEEERWKVKEPDRYRGGNKNFKDPKSFKVEDSMLRSAMKERPSNERPIMIERDEDLGEEDYPINLDFVEGNLNKNKNKGDRERFPIILKRLSDLDLNIIDDYLVKKSESGSDSLTRGDVEMEVVVEKLDIKIGLHSGYDLHSTRQTIEDARKSIRKRLRKIRQLLATGNPVEESIEDEMVSKTLFKSVHLGLSSSTHGLSNAQILTAIDNELSKQADDDDLRDEEEKTNEVKNSAEEDKRIDEGDELENESTTGSWQSLKSKPILKDRARVGSYQRSSELCRSIKPMLELELLNVGGRFRKFFEDLKEGEEDLKVKTNEERNRSSSSSLRVENLNSEPDSLTICCRNDKKRDTVKKVLSLELKVLTLTVIDGVPTSTWKKFLTELRPSEGGILRPRGSPMLRIKFDLVPSSSSSSSSFDGLRNNEALIKVKISPLRLYIDQDALDFIKKFFEFQKNQTNGDEEQEDSELEEEEEFRSMKRSKEKDDMNDDECVSEVEDHDLGNRGGRLIGDVLSKAGSGNEMFFQKVEIYPIRIKLDYKPKRINFLELRDGNLIEMMNFFNFDGSDMVLRHVNLIGVSKPSKIGELLKEIWTPDVKANQLGDVISGIAPIRSVVNLGNGLADLILLPIEQVKKKDGRLVRGLQRGSTSFAKSTALEAIKFGAKLAIGTQVVLEKAEGIFIGGGGSIKSKSSKTRGDKQRDLSLTEEEVLRVEAIDEDLDDQVVLLGSKDDDKAIVSGSNDSGARFKKLSRYSEQPENLKQGAKEGYKDLRDHIRVTAQTILAVPLEVFNEGSGQAVVKAVPIAILHPMVGFTGAISKTLLGMRHSIDENTVMYDRDKYKR